MLCGWDPIAYARLSGTERLLADVVLEIGSERRLSEMSQMAEAIGAHCAASVARMMSP